MKTWVCGGECGRAAHLHAGDVDPLPDAELLTHQSQFRHTVQHHVVELDHRHENKYSRCKAKSPAGFITTIIFIYNLTRLTR